MGPIIQAYASSLTAAPWILGKVLLYVAVGLVELVICSALGMFAFDYQFPTDPSVLVVATVLYLVAGVFFGMMMSDATGNQSATIQDVQMGSFRLSLLTILVRQMPYAGAQTRQSAPGASENYSHEKREDNCAC